MGGAFHSRRSPCQTALTPREPQIGSASQRAGKSMSDIETIIEQAWEQRDEITPGTGGEVRSAVERALAMLDRGEARVAEKKDGEWATNQWLKKAVLLSFRLNDMTLIGNGPGGAAWWDKVPSKFEGWAGEK